MWITRLFDGMVLRNTRHHCIWGWKGGRWKAYRCASAWERVFRIGTGTGRREGKGDAVSRAVSLSPEALTNPPRLSCFSRACSSVLTALRIASSCNRCHFWCPTCSGPASRRSWVRTPEGFTTTVSGMAVSPVMGDSVSSSATVALACRSRTRRTAWSTLASGNRPSWPPSAAWIRSASSSQSSLGPGPCQGSGRGSLQTLLKELCRQLPFSCPAHAQGIQEREEFI